VERMKGSVARVVETPPEIPIPVTPDYVDD
jgi:hypothetical protein